VDRAVVPDMGKERFEFPQYLSPSGQVVAGRADRRGGTFRSGSQQLELYHAVLVPVLWGAREHHGNALNIYLPDSQTTWVFVNLDSNIVDFKFWMPPRSWS
jgi:hypothetical protein